MSEIEGLLNRVFPDAADAAFPPLRRKSLPDELGHGPFEVVIGDDDRKRVTDTKVFPASAIAQLIVTSRDGAEFGGTGIFVAPRTILTAAHNLFIHSDDQARHGLVREVVIIPGRNASQLPFGSKKASNAHIPEPWKTSHSIAHDYALVFVSAAAPPGVGQATISVRSDEELNARSIFISGYPIDRPIGTQWVHKGRVQKVFSTQLRYDVDTTGGQSGAPVLVSEDGHVSIIGIHRFGDEEGNLGTRITQAVQADIAPRLL